MPPKPFPAVTGRCYCGAVKYQLLTSPLFCYACHCPDCQKATGSAFSLHATIETSNIRILSPTPPTFTTLNTDPSKPAHAGAHVSRRALCGQCGTVFWGNDNAWGYAVSDVRVGTLDFPGIMEPDVHSFVGSKVGWLTLPEGARTSRGTYDYNDVWPKSSLKRLEACLERFERAKEGVAWKEGKGDGKGDGKVEGGAREKSESPVEGDGDKTPTAMGDAEEGEDDEAFEERYRETERVLQERLAKLSLKLEGEEKAAPGGTTT